jgi:hypothetical protein
MYENADINLKGPINMMQYFFPQKKREEIRKALMSNDPSDIKEKYRQLIGKIGQGMNQGKKLPQDKNFHLDEIIFATLGLNNEYYGFISCQFKEEMLWHPDCWISPISAVILGLNFKDYPFIQEFQDCKLSAVYPETFIALALVSLFICLKTGKLPKTFEEWYKMHNTFEFHMRPECHLPSETPIASIEKILMSKKIFDSSWSDHEKKYLIRVLEENPDEEEKISYSKKLPVVHAFTWIEQPVRFDVNPRFIIMPKGTTSITITWKIINPPSPCPSFSWGYMKENEIKEFQQSEHSATREENIPTSDAVFFVKTMYYALDLTLKFDYPSWKFP